MAGTSLLPWGATLGAKESSDLPDRLMPKPFRTGFVRGPVLRPYKTARNRDGELVDHFEVVLRRGRERLIPGHPTIIFGYNGIAPGPTIKVRRGRPAMLRVRNKLPLFHPDFRNEFTVSTHLHGSASLPQYDGYASDVTPPGFYKEYHYPNRQAARTLWYHDHGVHHTGQNSYAGMFAQYHIKDEAERDLLPQGEFDVPLTIADVMFAANGRLMYDDRGEKGVWGDVVMVNGRPWPVMKVKRRVYRFRILVAAGGRTFQFALDNGDPMTVVATDGGLMPRSVEVDRFRASSAERYEVLIDFSRYRPGQRVVLRNLSPKKNRDYEHTDKVMAFDVTDAPFSKRDHTWRRKPDRLVSSHTMDLRPEQAKRKRTDELKREGGQWVINGKTWEDVIQSDFQLLNADPGLGDIEIWELANPRGGWIHPAHLHLVDFKMLTRNGKPVFDYERGPKDTAYLGPNETVRVLVKFGPHRGRYMVHCHNLAHEDHDMMVQYAVGWKPGRPDPNDPILAAPPRVDNLPPLRSRMG